MSVTLKFTDLTGCLHDIANSSNSFILECGHIVCIACYKASTDPQQTVRAICEKCNYENSMTDKRWSFDNFLHEGMKTQFKIQNEFKKDSPTVACQNCISDTKQVPTCYCFSSFPAFYCTQHMEIKNREIPCPYITKEDSIEENFSNLYITNSHTTTPIMCESHRGRCADYYCVNEQLFYCSLCIGHEGHKCSKTDNIIAKCIKCVKDNKEQLIYEINSTKQQIQNSEEIKNKWLKEYSSEKQELENNYNIELKILQEKFARNLNNLEQEHQIKLKKVEVEKSQHEMKLNQYYRFQRISELSMQILSPIQFVNHRNLIETVFKKVIRNDFIPNNTVSAQLTPSAQRKKNSLELKKIKENPKQNEELAHPLKMHYTPTIADNKSLIDTIMTIRPETPTKTSVRINLATSMNSIDDVTVDKFDNMFILDGIQKIVLLYNSKGEKIRTFKLASQIKQASFITSICYFSKKLILITNDMIYSLDDEGKVEPITNNYIKGLFKTRIITTPRGMAASHTGEHLYVCDYKTNQIVILDENLNYVRSLENITEPVSITTTRNGSIYILRNSSPSDMLVLDKNGKYERTIQLHTFCAHYLTTDQHDNILISCGGEIESHIAFYTATGELIKLFNGYNSTDQLKKPMGIAVDSKDRLIVTEYEDKCVKIFSKYRK